MRIRATAAMAAVLLCAASLGSAQTVPPGTSNEYAAPGMFPDYGPGLMPCGEWLDFRRGQSRPEDWTMWKFSVTWVLGWVSAAHHYKVRGACV
jgi:hypothetical protein